MTELVLSVLGSGMCCCAGIALVFVLALLYIVFSKKNAADEKSDAVEEGGFVIDEDDAAPRPDTGAPKVGGVRVQVVPGSPRGERKE